MLHGRIREGRHERAILSQEEPGNREERDRLEQWLRVKRRREGWYWRVGTSLMLVSAGVLLMWCYPCRHQTENSAIMVRFPDQIEKALVAHLASGQNPPGTGSSAVDSTLKLDPKLEAALQEYLRKPAAKGGMPWSVLVIIILAAGALVWWAMKQEPQATPLSAAIATLTATAAVIEKLVASGIAPPVHNVPRLAVLVSLTLLAGAIVLGVAGSRRLLSVIRSKDPEPVKTGSLVGAALLAFAFSAALLAVVPPLLFHSEPVPPQPAACPQCPPPTSVMAAEKISVFSLPAIKDLGDGRGAKDKKVDPTKIHQLTNNIEEKKAHDGDILLLLGSADCIPTRPKKDGGLWDSNDELAKARADWVSTGLDGKAAVRGVKIEALPLPQHAHCGTTLDLRAVYPFLVHAENGQVDESRH
jgi:hypothetical protein